MIETIKKEAEEAAEELIETAKLEEGEILVVGCSTRRKNRNIFQ